VEASSRASSWGLEKVGMTFLGAFGIFTLTNGVCSTIPSLISQDQNALMDLRQQLMVCSERQPC